MNLTLPRTSCDVNARLSGVNCRLAATLTTTEQGLQHFLYDQSVAQWRVTGDSIKDTIAEVRCHPFPTVGAFRELDRAIGRRSVARTVHRRRIQFGTCLGTKELDLAVLGLMRGPETLDL